jgi:hypothetical protein
MMHLQETNNSLRNSSTQVTHQLLRHVIESFATPKQGHYSKKSQDLFFGLKLSCSCSAVEGENEPPAQDAYPPIWVKISNLTSGIDRIRTVVIDRIRDGRFIALSYALYQ